MATATASKTTVRPLEDRLIVKPQEAEEKTKSGLYLPEGAKEKPMMGKVIAAGPGKTNDKGEHVAMTVKKGDTVVYGKYSGTEIELEDEKFLIIREGELLGVLEK
ncbi:MAG: co-chaperone GroES [Planctomycetes bacterium]|nr:co-chaperone GroES [Planctomycetota bacterium]